MSTKALRNIMWARYHHFSPEKMTIELHARERNGEYLSKMFPRAFISEQIELVGVLSDVEVSCTFGIWPFVLFKLNILKVPLFSFEHLWRCQFGGIFCCCSASNNCLYVYHNEFRMLHSFWHGLWHRHNFLSLSLVQIQCRRVEVR